MLFNGLVGFAIQRQHFATLFPIQCLKVIVIVWVTIDQYRVRCLLVQRIKIEYGGVPFLLRTDTRHTMNSIEITIPITNPER